MIYQELIDRGLISPRNHYQIEAAGAGFNSCVYVVLRPGSDPTLVVRVRRPDDRSTAEIDALSDVAACPGSPRLHLLTHELLVLDYLPGAPRDLAELDELHFAKLAQQLACIHGIEYPAYTPWPEQELREGTLADLFRFRVASLANYACFDAARGGETHPQLPELIQLLDEVDLASPSWEFADFSRLHGDLSRGNLLWNGDEIGLIDWEFSRIGDPAEDLAYLLTEQPGGVDLLPRLVAAYVAAGGAPDVEERIPRYGLFTAVDSALWWTDYAKTHDIDARSDIEERIAAATRWLPLLEGR